MTNTKRKQLVEVYDLVSLISGLIAVCLGALSVFALQPWWKSNPEWSSFIITCVTLVFDVISCASAGVSYLLGRKIYKLIDFTTIDPIEHRLSNHERKSYRFDQISFIIGIFGLFLGLASLLTDQPWNYEDVSETITIVAIFFDFTSALMIVFAIWQYHRYLTVKDIFREARRSIRMRNKAVEESQNNSEAK